MLAKLKNFKNILAIPYINRIPKMRHPILISHKSSYCKKKKKNHTQISSQFESK